jgi:DNA-binding NarL/FixJ family response regulator
MVRVAIVDDHPIARYGVKQLLAGVDGLQVVASAASPGELADHMPGTDECPNVVILDLYYGGDAPCLEAIGQLGTAARVLVMSASGRPADVLGAIRAGAAGYITKQADGLMFAAAVEAVARGGFWLSAELADIVHAELSRRPRQDPHPARPRRLKPGSVALTDLVTSEVLRASATRGISAGCHRHATVQQDEGRRLWPESRSSRSGPGQAARMVTAASCAA